MHEYVCGMCGALNMLEPKDAVRCCKCNYRVMYKTRPAADVSFLAR